MIDHQAALFARLRAPLPLTSPRGVLAANARPAAPPRDASTVVLLRDAHGGGVEAYLVQRVRAMTFGGVYAFPGGRVDSADNDPTVGNSAVGGSLGAVIGPNGPGPRLAHALVCAAVRETFEECGVLLAAPTADAGRPLDLAGPEWLAERQALERRELGLGELLARHGLAPRTDLLAPWARWITPEVEPRRFDTWFFVAALPPGQTPGELSGEADRMVWIRPQEALERHAAGTMPMLPPTACVLADLLGQPSVAAVLAAARDRVIAPIRPKIVIADGAVHFLLPHDPEYATAAPSADSASSKAMLAVISRGRGHRAAVTASTTVEQA